MTGPVAIIGAGAAGLACARALRGAGVAATLYDKGRAPGGRVCTRRSDGWHFDHGAQYLSAKRDALPLQELAGAGVLAPWPGLHVDVDASGKRLESAASGRLVGIPGMSAITRYLAADLPIRRVTLSGLRRAGGGWQLHADGQPVDGPYPWVIVTTPAPQALALLDAVPAELSPLTAVTYASCWTTALGFEQPPVVNASSLASAGAIRWAAQENSKPGRDGKPVWLLQASAEFSARHAQASSYLASSELVRHLAALLDAPLTPAFSWSRYWRYAFVDEALACDYLVSNDAGIAYAGDACRGSRVEHAFASGTALGRALAALPEG